MSDKRFQSGHEVLIHYVRGYEGSERSVDPYRQPTLLPESGQTLASTLLTELRRSIGLEPAPR